VTDKHAICGEADVNNVVKTAREAFRGDWSRLTGAQRGQCLYRLADLLDKNHEEAAYNESICSGRVMSQLLYEVPWIASVIRYYAGWADKLEGDTLPADDGFYKLIQHEALGVCAGITPWNGPLMVLALKAAPALATGNTFILKPPEKSPLSSLYAGSLFSQAGIPDGVFNIVTGDGLTGNLLARHMDIDKVSFTGSVPTGRKIQEAANASNMKRVTLELGGKSPAVVFEDGDLANAVVNLAQGITMNAGQVCVASSRVLVQKSGFEEVVAGLKDEFERISASIGGDPLDPTTTFGPVIDSQQYERVHSYIEQGKTEAQLVTGGYQHTGPGNYIPPTLFIEPEAEATIYKEEIFGPVLCVRSFETEEEAIALANDTLFGLAGIFHCACAISTDTNRNLQHMYGHVTSAACSASPSNYKQGMLA
jgi:aldehyde dehydrogenase (NAD+)